MSISNLCNIKFKMTGASRTQLKLFGGSASKSRCLSNIQKRLLTVGVFWVVGEQVIKYTSKNYFYINKQGKMCYVDNQKAFDRLSNQEVSLQGLDSLLTSVEKSCSASDKYQGKTVDLAKKVLTSIKPQYLAYMTMNDAKKALSELYGQPVRIVSNDFDLTKGDK